MTASTVDVRCSAEGGGWTCRVTVRDAAGSTEHSVTVAEADLRRLDPAAGDPSVLVRRSFDFLLTREPKESILRSFDLQVIGRYFPEYDRDIRRG
jgi:hypothetical protein